LRARGKSLIADWHSNGQKATALRLGRAEGLTAPKLIRVPYMNIDGEGPSVLLSGDTFVSTLLDWYNTECSSFYARSVLEGESAAAINGGGSYWPLTDGTRNPWASASSSMSPRGSRRSSRTSPTRPPPRPP